MKRISLLGDVHSNPCPPVPNGTDLGIQVGDYGYGFKPLQTLQSNSVGWRTIRGNHDSPEVAQNDSNYLGDYGYLAEYNLFFLSGAWSIDWQKRTPGVNWWENEELSYGELLEAFNLYKMVQPKIVVTHDCPFTIGQMILDQLGNRAIFGNTASKTRTSLCLQTMFDWWQPTYHVFGHYHEPFRKIVNGTQFIGLDCGEVATLEV